MVVLALPLFLALLKLVSSASLHAVFFTSSNSFELVVASLGLVGFVREILLVSTVSLVTLFFFLLKLYFLLELMSELHPLPLQASVSLLDLDVVCLVEVVAVCQYLRPRPSYFF